MTYFLKATIEPWSTTASSLNKPGWRHWSIEDGSCTKYFGNIFFSHSISRPGFTSSFKGRVIASISESENKINGEKKAIIFWYWDEFIKKFKTYQYQYIQVQTRLYRDIWSKYQLFVASAVSRFVKYRIRNGLNELFNNNN